MKINKKIIRIGLGIAFSIGLMGCGNEQMRAPDTDKVANLHTDSAGTFEWVSPDGVHYWVYQGVYRFGIAPRYDSNGELIIDKEKE